MSEKYIEQPAFETNEFKVGDMVRCYKVDTLGTVDFKIIKVDNDTLLGKYMNQFGHFKQCRLLKEVKPREFWIREQNVGDLLNGKYVYGEGATISKDSACNLQGDGPYIKFREVLED